MNGKELLRYRPENVNKLLGGSPYLLLNSRPIFSAIIDENVMLMACNARIRHVIPGIMKAAMETDAVVGFELARSEGDTKGGYTGQTPKIYFETIMEYAEMMNFDKPFFIHGDHTTVKDTSDEEFNAARELILAEIEAGYTSIAIDASHNELPDNIRITKQLSHIVEDAGLGLEVEVGEIAGMKGELTTVEEALEFITALKNDGINPNLLAISNGSKHGNYAPGEEVHIDLKRTKEVFDAIRPYGVSIAQHGITGTPLHLMWKFTEHGIRKGNVGTNWQNIAHKHLPKELFEEMQKWTKEHNENIKRATKVFKAEIDSIPQKNRDAIAEEAYESAKQFIKAFRAEGTATLIREKLR